MKRVRPNYVDRGIYTSFGNRCRDEGVKISKTLERLMKRYTEQGEKVFKK